MALHVVYTEVCVCLMEKHVVGLWKDRVPIDYTSRQSIHIHSSVTAHGHGLTIEPSFQ